MTNAQYIPGVAELGRKNQPSGYVGIDSSGDVLGTFAQRVDTEANLSSVVLANGELAYASDTQSVFIGDGVKAGGVFLWQMPQRKSITYSGLLQAPEAIAAITDDDGCVIPVGPNRKYIVDIVMRASSDSGNQSNFAVRFGLGEMPSIVSADQVYAYMKWHWADVPNGNHVDAGCLTYFANSNIALPAVISPLSELTQSTMSFVGQWMFHTFDRLTPFYDAHVMVVARTGTTSPANATLTLAYQRIA